ncbi:alpha/beta fold hydrolase [Marinomonas sp.]
MRSRIETEALGNIQNPAIFMVSGWAMPKEVMRPFALALSQKYYVVLANLPGISNDESWVDRSRTGMNYDIDALTEQLIDVAPDEAWWLGWSLGGMISAYVAARRSSCVNGLITIASLPSFVEREGWQYGMSIETFDEFVGSVKAAPKQSLKRFLGLQTLGAQDPKNLMKTLAQAIPMESLNPTALVGGLRLLKGLDVRREWSLLNVPSLHILGANDTLVSKVALEDYTVDQPIQKNVILADCAHQPFIEYPQLCVQEIENFIDANHP